ncbi:FadR family transcriptional regulator [Nakamurella flavida]|uniref:FadR family transcriptional regulator n=1 Tax=Nakamurella flavida TaxID=363630 RepID=A0A938YIF3_9ACTN|nr:FadR family transcriptional regulator [Nakamurella flavida]
MTAVTPPAAEAFQPSPVERYSTVGAVAKQLLTHLTTGHFAPGTRLPAERTLAASLGVARSTLREAMAALDVLGIVEVRPGSGSYLTSDSSEMLPQALKWSLLLGQPRTRDLIEVREYLEVITARLAAARATEEGIARLGVHMDGMRSAGGDVEAFVRADIAFHLEAAHLAGNTVLQDILHSVRSLLQVWFDRTLRVPGTLEETLLEHEAVFQAIGSRSPELAEERMKALMDAADRRLTASMADLD